MMEKVHTRPPHVSLVYIRSHVLTKYLRLMRVPSFGSYRPRVPQQPDPRPNEQSEAGPYQCRVYSHGKQHHSSRSVHPVPHSPTRDASVRSEGFVLDRYGDKNTNYGPPRSTTRYSRVTSCVLGLPEDMQIVSSTHTAVSIESARDGRTPGLYARLAASTSDAPERVIALDSTPEYPEFVSVNDDGSSEYHTESNALGNAHAAVRDLNEYLDLHGEDTDAWLRLVQLQEQIMDTANTASVARVKVAVIERAQQIPNNTASIPLALAKMRLLADFGLQSSAQLNSEWRQLVEQSHGDDAVALWFAYLQFRRSDWHAFGLDSVLQLHAEAIHALSEYEYGAKLDAARIQVVVDAATLLQGAGHLELAVALLQALLELNFEVSNLPDDSVLDIFEAWWDSGPVRIGDAGDYMGFSPSRKPDLQPGAPAQNEEHATGSDWAINELNCASDVPMRLYDQGRDPFSYILADDMRYLLFFVSKRQVGLVRLLDAYLYILGLPLGWLQATVALLRGECVEKVASFPRVLPKWSSSEFPAESAVNLFPPTFDTLYTRTMDDPRGQWFTHTVLPNLRASRAISHFAGRLAQMGIVMPELAVTHAALVTPKTCVAADSGCKILRHALQQNQSSVALWCAYAQYELALGNADIVRRVCSQVLAAAAAHPMSSSLWSLWAELEWVSGRNDVCWGVLREASKKSRNALDLLAKGHASVTSVDKLQVLRQLRTERGHAVLMPLAIAESLSQSVEATQETTNALTIFCRAHESANQSDRGQIAMGLLKFLRLQSCRARGAFRPRDVQSALLGMINDAPSPVLEMLHSVEIFRLGSNVRRAADLMPRDFPHLAVALSWYMRSHASEHFLRRRIDLAVEAEPTVPLLWYMGLALERKALKFGSSSTAHMRAKALIYKGIKHCPAEKSKLLLTALYLTAFLSHFRAAFSDEELRELASMLGEKELRVYAEFDAYATDALSLVSQFVDSIATSVA